MGYIKEPVGIDFVVDPTPLTEKDRKKISEVIAFYKATGKRTPITKPSNQKLVKSKSKKEVA
ncbi:MAG: hypothetical protein ACOYMA_17955 [Bacteroidia bacterium]